jgi:hypothetical protein
MNEHPIDPFLAAWSAASGVDGFAARLRVYQALRLPGPWTRARLRAALAAVLVLAPEHHDRFAETFDLWFYGDERDEEVEISDLAAWLAELKTKTERPGRAPAERPRDTEQGSSLEPKQRVPRQHWRWVALGGGLVLLLVLLAWLLRQGCSSAPATRDAGPDVAETATCDTGAAAVQEAPPTETWARHKLAFRITDAPAPAWRRGLLWIAAVLAVFCLLLEWLLARRRRRFKTVKAKPILLSDGQSELDLCSGPPPKPLSAAALDRIAFRTGLVPDFELPKLNPGKTVRRTAKNAGSFSPVHDPRAQTRGLSIVRPLRMEPVSEAVLSCFADGLSARAVPVRILSGPPRWDTDDLVLLLVDGRFPDDPPVERWLTIPHLALVEVRDPETWGSEVGRLPRGVFPLDAEGLYAAIEVAATRRQPPRLQRTRRHDVLSGQGIAGLGNALPLAAACALIGAFDLGSADELRRELLPDTPFLAFQRVLGLRGLMTDGRGWRMSSALARQLLERVGSELVCRVLQWQERRLAALAPAPGLRACKMLEREQALVRLQLQLLEGEGLPSERSLLHTVQALEAHLGEPSLERRVAERLLTLPDGWLNHPAVPESAGHRVGRMRGDEQRLFPGRDPSKRSQWLYLADAGTIATAALLVWAARSAAPYPWLEVIPEKGTGVWVVRNNQVENGALDYSARAYPDGMGSIRLIGFGPGSPAIHGEFASKETCGTADLTRTEGEVAEHWTCKEGKFDPGPGGPKRLASIVSLPLNSTFDEPGRELLRQGIATCIVRESSLSLPLHADDVAQTLRVERLEDLPKQRAVGYEIPPSGFWVRPRSQEVPLVPGPDGKPVVKRERQSKSFHTQQTWKGGRVFVYGRQVSDKGALDLRDTKVSDISALKGMPLIDLDLSDTKVSDISALKGMPLSSLLLRGTQVSDVSALKSMPLGVLSLYGTQVSDISALKGKPLIDLDLSDTKVSDISALKGMPLTHLNLSGTKVSDISALKGMPLTHLNLSGTKVSDISALKGMPLTHLDLPGLKDIDISALKDMPLTSLYLLSMDLSGQELQRLLRLAESPTLSDLLNQLIDSTRKQLERQLYSPPPNRKAPSLSATPVLPILPPSKMSVDGGLR